MAGVVVVLRGVDNLWLRRLDRLLGLHRLQRWWLEGQLVRWGGGRRQRQVAVHQADEVVVLRLHLELHRQRRLLLHVRADS